MSHQYEDRDYPITYIETDYDYYFDYSYDAENGFLYVPSIPEFFTKEFKGLSYEGVSYTWDEIEYRMGVDYPQVPEFSGIGVIMGLVALSCIFFTKLINRYEV
jgi:hypothetical protein